MHTHLICILYGTHPSGRSTTNEVIRRGVHYITYLEASNLLNPITSLLQGIRRIQAHHPTQNSLHYNSTKCEVLSTEFRKIQCIFNLSNKSIKSSPFHQRTTCNQQHKTLIHYSIALIKNYLSTVLKEKSDI